MTGDLRSGLETVSNMIDSAQRFEAEVLNPRDQDPNPGYDKDGIAPGQWVPNHLGLPESCPVVPLGVKGDVYFFLDTLNQLRAVQDKEFSKGKIGSLFMGRINFVMWAWARPLKDGTVNNFCADKVRDDLMAACAIKGPWDPAERVRGCGAWRSARGGLILHTGDRLIVDGREKPVGELGGYVYPADRAIWSPWDREITDDDPDHPARILMPLLRRWNWERPDVDPVLLLGWIVSAFLGGALDWRSFAFMTGDKGTGKSSLQAIIKGLFGEGIVSTTNTTAAGIYQTLRNASLPVAVDEFESRDDNRRAQAILELARQASSGGRGLRGGADHVGSEFAIRSSFIFSAINAPPLEPADLSRFALLRLNKIADDAPPLVIDTSKLVDVGRKILRIICDAWHRFEPTQKAIADELKAAGHDGRGADTFGTLLTCASLLIGNTFEDELVNVPLGEDLTPWRQRLDAKKMTEFASSEENWRACLAHLLGTAVKAWRGGGRVTVGATLETFLTKKEPDGDSSQLTFGQTRQQLSQAGLGLQKPSARGGGYWLAVPHNNPLLWELFEGSKWSGAPGCGVWSHALQQGPKGLLWELGSMRINGNKCKCVRISLDALYGEHGIMTDDE